MKKSLAHYLVAGALAAAALPLASAGAFACGYYQPGLLAFVTGIRPATCVYQGDYIVQQGPTYDGPALIAPQPTYAPSRTVAGYVHGPYQAQPAVEIDPAPVYSRERTRVRNDQPSGKGKVQIINARAQVRIYGSERMEIKLYRH